MKPIIYVFGEGLVGSRIIKALRATDKFTVVTNKQAPHGYRIKSTPAGIDIDRMIKDLSATFGKPDLIINALGVIGKPNVDWCEDNKHETRYGNVDIPVDLGWAAIKLGVPYIHISTGCIFSSFDGDVFMPNDEPNFIDSFYSRTKADAEYQLRMMQKEYPEGRVEIHRIRMPFYKESDPRNLIDKLILYDTLVDSPNSMTNLDDYVEFMVTRAEETLKTMEGVYEEDEGWFEILHAVNKGPLAHSEIISFLKEFAHIEFKKEKKFITPKQLNKNCKTPRSNCILGDEQLPDVRASMLGVVRAYKQDKKKKS